MAEHKQVIIPGETVEKLEQICNKKGLKGLALVDCIIKLVDEQYKKKII